MPRRAPSPSLRASLAIAGPSGGGPAEGQAEAQVSNEAPPPIPSAELAALAVPARSRGPLDAEQGARSFDNERTGQGRG